jgi:hypothetical protein
MAAVCNAVMDVISYHWYGSSLVNKVSAAWWNPDFSWRNKYSGRDPKNGLRKWWIFDVPCTDAWHTFKSLMVVFVVLSVITFDLGVVDLWWVRVVAFCVYGIVWNVVFNLFYNKILRNK